VSIRRIRLDRVRKVLSVGGTAALAVMLVGLLWLGSPAAQPTSDAAAVPPTYGTGLSSQALEGSNNQTAGPSMSGQVFWAYVEDEGSLDLTVAFRNRVDGGTATTATIRAVSPSGTAYDHTVPIAPADPMPALHILGLTDARAGVWRINFDDGAASGDHDAGISTWGITPRTAGGVAQKGRAFTEEYTQTVQATRPIDPDDTWDRTWSETLYFLNRHGVTYQGVLRRYNPIQGAISASPRGVLAADGTSRHASASFHDASASVDSNRYWVFFEQPDVAMPDEATFASRGTQWLGPNYRDPLIADITHAPTPSQSDAPWAGTISWTVAGAAGVAQVQLDTDSDGQFDRTLVEQGANGGLGTAHEVSWDGRNSLGDVVARSQGMTARVVMKEVAEIHFTLTDVEQLAGGLEVTALSGPQSGAKRLSWNDTELGPRCDTNTARNSVDCASKPSPIKANDLDSTGGIHRWSRATAEAGGWGDARHIDNWTATQVDVTATAGLPGTRIDAHDDTASTTATTPVTLAVLDNDDVPPGVGVRFAEVPLPGVAGAPDDIVDGCATLDGEWVVNADQTVTYTPADGFHGVATCRYLATEGGSASAALITVTVSNALRPRGDKAATHSGVPVVIPVLDNDRDVNPFATVKVSEADRSQGRWEVRPDQTIVFWPSDAFHGVARASYTVVEPDGRRKSAAVSVVVLGGGENVADLEAVSAGVDGADDHDGGAVGEGLIPNLGGPTVIALAAALAAIMLGLTLLGASRRRSREETS
jgi:hypothetical protein